MFRRALTVAVGLLIAGITTAADKPGPNDWPQWRGQNRDGKSPETGLLKSWPKDGPPKAWTVGNLGTGFGTPSVAGGKIFGVGTRGGKDGVWALNEADGKEAWFTPIVDPAKTAPQNNGPASTPTFHDGKVYVVSGNGTVARLDAATGKLEWSKSYLKDFGSSVPTWGFSDSVLVDGDKVICAPSSAAAAVVALKASTGGVLWKTPVEKAGAGFGYSSPMKTTVGGVPMYVVVLGQAAGVVGVHADTGKLLWQYNKKEVFGGVAQIPTPIISGDKVFVSVAYNGGSALLQLVAEGANKVEVKEVKFYDNDPMNHHGGMILINGSIYFGHGQNNGIPVCVDLATGDVVWHADRPPAGAKESAAYSYADGMLYVRYQNHLMTLVQPSTKEEENKVVSSFMIPDASKKQSWPHPVIANGKLYLRDQEKLQCFNIKAGSK